MLLLVRIKTHILIVENADSFIHIFCFVFFIPTHIMQNKQNIKKGV
jgi:hypothetical protein